MDDNVQHLFDAMAGSYDELEPWYVHLYARLHAIARRALAPAPGAPAPAALDAGCGTGFQTALLAGLGYRAHGLDLSAALLEVARARLPSASFVRGRLEALPYGDARFDAVACCGSTLSFVDEPPQAVRELGRVLRGGGRLLLECEHKWSADLAWMAASALTGDALGYGVSARALWQALARPLGASCRLPYPGYGPLHLLTRHDVEQWLRAAGLSVVQTWGIHSVTGILPSTLLHRPRLPGALRPLYAGLCVVDGWLTGVRPARALAGSLVVLAQKR